MIEAVDRNEQHDARRVVWNGEGVGLVRLFAADTQNLMGYLDADSALVFDIKVAQAPTEKTNLRLVCGSACMSDIDFTSRLTEAAGKDWQTVSIGLSCFPVVEGKTSADLFSQVVEPFSLMTEGTLDVTFANVKIVKGAAKDKACK